MYEERYIAFIDILGFGSLVETSASNPEIVQGIENALSEMVPAKLIEEMYGFLNEDVIPDDSLARARNVAKTLGEILAKKNPITVSYFSDSLVLSAAYDDVIASQTILELIAKLSVRLWNEYSLVIRGGITIGSLTHKPNGPLFGPAMNRAYHLESKEALYPRVLVDKICLEHFQRIRTFQIFDSLIEHDEHHAYFSLPSALRYLATSSTLAMYDNERLRDVIKTRKELEAKINEIIALTTVTSVRDKYIWLAQESRMSSFEHRLLIQTPK
ncbi:MAG: hypothetical protein KJ556_12750 [Gammaproteobacteria bacterium]|nr:hypothetical protein [Gammaproteobacteria bacterium]MBU2058082.1 hypothetical protein [Gammaproteobacteria bacterium]MBU2175989.1 hypothetical protein [Gammaproteobacteria bacterium]MBU2247176.1 hypothetical protein [Gammaproteobacteria bacterium]MBU2343328.1 hypothetical protein [Gammaproteobacteria bacterium]